MRITLNTKLFSQGRERSRSPRVPDRSASAGRAAFTNYLGTSVLMMLVFHGWGFGLFGKLNRPQLYIVVVLAWVLMLAWSKPWLYRFRYGPLEWLWRMLTYGVAIPLRTTQPRPSP